MMALIDHFFPPAPLRYRDGGPADAAALAALHATAFARGWEVEEFERLLSERAARAHVAVAGGKLVGFVLSHVVAPEAEILSIAVAQAARRRGIGRGLLQHHLGRLAAEGVTTSFLEVEAGNTAALQLYGAFGYGEIGRRRGYYAGVDALLLRRDF